MLLDLRIVLFSVNFGIKRSKKVFMGCLAMSCIVVYSTTIIPDAIDKVDNSIKLKVVKHWST